MLGMVTTSPGIPGLSNESDVQLPRSTLRKRSPHSCCGQNAPGACQGLFTGLRPVVAGAQAVHHHVQLERSVLISLCTGAAVSNSSRASGQQQIKRTHSPAVAGNLNRQQFCDWGGFSGDLRAGRLFDHKLETQIPWFAHYGLKFRSLPPRMPEWPYFDLGPCLYFGLCHAGSSSWKQGRGSELLLVQTSQRSRSEAPGGCLCR